MTDVSVVLPTYNRPRELERALESVRRLETSDLSIEILVVDNGSNPETREVAARHGAHYLSCGTSGAATSRNLGLEHAIGEFVAFLDDDDWWAAGHLRPELELLRDRPEFGAALGQIQLVDPNEVAVGDPFPNQLPLDGRAFEQFLSEWTQIGGFVIRREVALATGPFDPGVEGGEDWDWVLRLAKGTRIGFVRSPSLFYSLRPLSDPALLTINRARVVCNRRIFWRHAVRTHGPRAYLFDSRTFLRFRGRYFGIFMNLAAAQEAAGNGKVAQAARWEATKASPLHYLAHHLRGIKFRALRSAPGDKAP